MLVGGDDTGVELIKWPIFTQSVHSTTKSNKALQNALQQHQRAVSQSSSPHRLRSCRPKIAWAHCLKWF